MINQIQIANKTIGEDSPTFVIAEAGVNHNGSVEIAKNLIDAAKEVGADAVKFQTFKTENLVSKSMKDFFEMVKKLELQENELKELIKYAKKKDIVLFSTPTDIESVDLLDDLNLPAFKIASGDLTFLPLIKHAASKKRPLILSTGMSYLCEIEEALNSVYQTNNKNIILMHCVASYPAPIEETNLNVMKTLKNAFNLPVGFSDHTPGYLVPIIAASMGATVIEKHFTLDKTMEGPDHKASADIKDFKKIVEGIRTLEKAKGSTIKRPVNSESEMKINFRKSLTSKEDLAKNSIITEKNIAIKRPGDGIPPKYIDCVIGKKIKKDLKTDETIKWDSII